MTYTIAAMPGPNSSIPGTMAVLRGVYGGANSWGTKELRAVELRQAEWLPIPGPGCMDRLSAALFAVTEHADLSRFDKNGKPLKDPRDPWAQDQARLLLVNNHWSTAHRKLNEAGVRPDTILTVMPGTDEQKPDHTIGRLFLLDSLRDQLPLLQVALPEQRLADHPSIISAHELRSALREIQARPRTMDGETAAPGLDRGDMLLLTLAAGLEDLRRNSPWKAGSIRDKDYRWVV